jgi:hypothetical protein
VTEDNNTELDRIFVEGVEGFEGEWEIDLSNLTGRELRTIKRISGNRVNELPGAMLAGDYDLLIALAVVALQRGGHRFATQAEHVLLDAESGVVRYVNAKRGEDENVDPPSGSDESG